MQEICRLYRYVPTTTVGYVVYRHSDDMQVDVVTYARHHKVATFVEEQAAWDYCRHRNRLVELGGSDSLDDTVRIWRPGEHLSVTQSAKKQTLFTRRRPTYKVYFVIGEDGEPRHSAGVKPSAETLERVRRHVFYGVAV